VLPKVEYVKVNRDKACCPAKLPSQRYVVDSKTKGVRWALVWLKPANPDKALPIHPLLAPVSSRDVTIDQPRCMFEPRVVGVRQGQKLVVWNSARIAHAVNLQGGVLGPNWSRILPPGGKVEVTDLKARRLPIIVSCHIHPWMRAYVGVFDHPYFAVTNEKGEFEIKNAPLGKVRLGIWHPEKGWVVQEGKKSGKEGIPITIKGVTNVGKVRFVPPKDDD
jgi:hypothetical protein